jgi:hypothetical protein
MGTLLVTVNQAINPTSNQDSDVGWTQMAIASETHNNKQEWITQTVHGLTF